MDVLPDDLQTELPVELNTQARCIVYDSQKTIYTLLLDLVKRKDPTFVLSLFKDLFINFVENVNSAPSQAIHEIVFANNEDEFKNTLKRSCYILVNNWEAAREHQAIRELIAILSEPLISQNPTSKKLRIIRKWLKNFINSKDYQDLKMFALKHEDREKGHWSYRYTSYLLVPQYIDRTNPIEQRKAARTLSKQLKDKFKFDLAMYTSRAASAGTIDNTLKNPTGLGDEVINLIKMIVARRGQFNYVSLANIFIQQTQHLTYKDFKRSLQKYLMFCLANKQLETTLNIKLTEKFNVLYESYDAEPINKLLLLKTCERVIEFLTTENSQSPSEMFILLIFQKTPLILVILLLKIVLICQPSRLRLEGCIADLIRYYENFSESDCQLIINFVEIFNVTFTIYAEDVEYNLVKINNYNSDEHSIPEWEDYRVFSQLKGNAKPGADSLEEKNS
ncbi:hypothetical protein [Argonema antarcticum]|uniref:hypothetical protein n=1 Tax=Argonema antarcticum TaxID=2942763 RepID=UPI002013A350|nr:hypothetical protein [Argonema antarcticum]MCL1473289.1 hypothetical protein [Argonema antarcticum A004/B2]